MRKSVKITLISVTALLLIIIIGFYIAAHYICMYSLNREFISNIPPKASEYVDKEWDNYVEQVGEDNMTKINNAGTDWLNSVMVLSTSIINADGLKLTGKIVMQPETSDKWVIAVHGHGASYYMMRVYAKEYYEKGYNVLMPEMQACGNSEGEFYQMGWGDRLDMLLWIDEVLKINEDAQIVLHGLSMGASTVAMTSGETLPSNVRAIVSDSAYTSMWDEYSAQIKAVIKVLPDFPLLDMIRLAVKINAGYDIKTASAVTQVASSVTPTLFVHGSADTFVPTEMVYTLYNAANCEKQLLVVDGAAHASAIYTDFTLYWDTIFAFVGKYVD